MKNHIAESLILAAALVILGMFICRGFVKLGEPDRTVNVRGLAEREVPADRAYWSVSFSEQGNDISAMYASLNGLKSRVLKIFKENGLDSSEVSVNAPNLQDFYADPYAQNLPKIRYAATSSVSVSTSKVETVRALQAKIDSLTWEGLSVRSGFASYEFTGLNGIKPEMIAEATKNARAAGEKFAKDSESKLGKIIKASQGQFSIDDRDSDTPYIKKVRVVTSVVFSLED